MLEAQHVKVGRRKFTSLALRKTAVSDEAVARLKQSALGLAVER
jgi:hypothetical protein